jgi:hypothetical protein
LLLAWVPGELHTWVQRELHTWVPGELHTWVQRELHMREQREQYRAYLYLRLEMLVILVQHRILH